jgi:hypothetical protein
MLFFERRIEIVDDVLSEPAVHHGFSWVFFRALNRVKHNDIPARNTSSRPLADPTGLPIMYILPHQRAVF